MPVITKTQLENASLDAVSLALFTNGENNQDVITRLGETYPTLQKLISDIYAKVEYLVPVTYTSGLSMTTPNQTVIYSGSVYAPLVNQLPFTTSGTFETAKFRLIQGLTKNELVLTTGANLVGSNDGAGGSLWTTVAGFISKLLGSTGASLVGYLSAYTGAVITTVQDKLQESVSVNDFGALNNGSDATTAIQAAIDALPTNGILTGNGRSYVVTTLHLKSDMTLCDIFLTTKAGAVDFVAPITIDGTSAAKSNINLIKVVINGNRANQSSIVSASEDGGRHGFRVLGFVSDLLIDKCQANYCACDGLEFHASTAQDFTNDLNQCFKRITVKDCTFNWNRRIGISGHSIDGMLVDNCQTLNNGRNIGAFIANTHGNMGATVGNNGVSFYGQGIDFEGYNVGSNISNLTIRKTTSTGGIRGGIYFYDLASPVALGFASRTNITIDDCVVDAGVAGDPAASAISFYVDATQAAYKNMYKSVRIINSRIAGGVSIYGANGVLIDRNTITHTSTSSFVFPNTLNVDIGRNIFPTFNPFNPSSGGELMSFVDVYQSAATQVVSSSGAVLTLDSVVNDQAGEFTANAFTAKRFGYYSVSITMSFQGLPSSWTDVSVTYGGPVYPAVTRRILGFNPSETYIARTASLTVRLGKGDSIYFNIGPQGTGNATTINGRIWNGVTITGIR